MVCTSIIERWRLPLLSEVLKLCAEIGLTEGGSVERIAKPLHRHVLRILRTAESAARRLIIAAARDIVVEPGEPRPPANPRAKSPGKDKAKTGGEGKAKRKRGFLFNLFDSLKRQGRRFKKKRRGPEPHVHSIESFLKQKKAEIAAAQAKQQQVVDDGMVSAKNLVRRLRRRCRCTQ